MKNDLTCGLVRDLLPSYVEGLVCGETQEAVERHLADCPSCTAALDAMREPVPDPEAETAEQNREVDYLKKVKRHNRWRIAAAAVLAGCAVIAAFLFQLFERGVPLNHETVAITELSFLPEEGPEGCQGTLSLSLSSISSGKAFHSWRVATGDSLGVSYITAREVLASPLHSNGSGGMKNIPISSNTREVWLGGPSGRLLWQDGIVISRLALKLMDATTPYCGDPTAAARITDLLRLPVYFGSYTFSLQTAQPPYGWTLESANPIRPEQRSLVDAYNILALALVGNLEVSRCTHPSQDGTVLENSMTLEELDGTLLPSMAKAYNAANGTDWEIKASVKDYARSPADLQRLLLILDFSYSIGLTELGG